MTHRLLQRQLRKLGLDSTQTPEPEQWEHFLQTVERAYLDSDQDRYLLERSLEISSKEMQALYDDLKRTSEARYRHIFESVHDAIIVESMDGEILDVNNRACELYGWTRDEFLTKTITDLVPKEALAVVPEDLPDASAPERFLQTVNRRSDGTFFPVELSTTVQTLGDEEVMLVVVRDISAHKRAEEELIRSKERLRILFEFAPDAYYLANLKGVFLDGNSAAEKLMGYKKEELIGESMLKTNLLDKKDIPRAAKLLAKNILGQSTGPDVFDLLRKDGDRVTVEITTYPVRIEGETVVLGIARDISDRIKAEKALRESEERFRSVAETAIDAIVLMDNEYRIRFWNKAAQNIFGYSGDEVIEKDLTLVIPDDGMKQSLKNLNRKPWFGGKQGHARPTELVGRRKNGEEFPIELSFASWSSGETCYTSAIIRDVSEIRQVQQRTQLQDRLAAVGQLAAGIAHDFNNILGTITLYSELIMKSEMLLMKDRQRLKTIFDQAQRGAALTAQILDFGRKSMMERHAFDLLPFFEELRNLLSRTLPENIVLRLEAVEGDNYFVDADPTRMQQVIMNLALNATYAMPHGGELLFKLDRFNAHEFNKPFPTMKSGRWIRIIAADTGEGIPGETLPHIFEPFFTTKPLGEGTGLGLAQVYGIIKQHEGFIDAESEEGKGATFTIYMPALDGPPPSKPLPKSNTSQAGGGECIMVVEDDGVNRAAIAEILESIGYQVVQVEDGLQALSALEERSGEFNLIISDVVMPNMGGKDLHEAVTKHYPEIHMILMTGYPLGQETRKLFDRSRVTWLQKPLESEVLSQTVRNILG